VRDFGVSFAWFLYVHFTFDNDPIAMNSCATGATNFVERRFSDKNGVLSPPSPSAREAAENLLVDVNLHAFPAY
jgi:hypothetical protein